jgi:ATP-dependent helicase HrpB
VAGEIERMARQTVEAPRTEISENDFLRAVLAGYPDRVAKRRGVGSPKVLLSSGHGAVLAPDSGVRTAEYLVAVDVQAATAAEPGEARVRVASAIERGWLAATSTETEHRFEEATGRVQAFVVERYGALVLGERRVAPDADISARLLAERWLASGPGPDEERWLRRARFAAVEIHLDELVRSAAQGARALSDIEIASRLPHAVRATIDRLAPESIPVPSGRSVRLEYREDGGVEAAVKLQEVFGLAETPRLGPRRDPLVFILLAPNGRPVQVTRDLRSFWLRGYAEVRKELRGRYPKHPWPEDPWTATPTAKTKKKRTS